MIITTTAGARLFPTDKVLMLFDPRMLHLIIMEDVERFGSFLMGDICCCQHWVVEGSLGEGFAGGEGLAGSGDGYRWSFRGWRMLGS